MQRRLVHILLGLILTQAWALGQNGDLTPLQRAPSDTLSMKTRSEGIHYSRKELYGGLTLVFLSGIAAHYAHQQADAAYEKYLKEGNLDLINARYNRVRKYDRYTTAFYLGVQTGFLLIMKAFYP